jgi:hypothetical protein
MSSHSAFEVPTEQIMFSLLNKQQNYTDLLNPPSGLKTQAKRGNLPFSCPIPTLPSIENFHFSYLVHFF